MKPNRENLKQQFPFLDSDVLDEIYEDQEQIAETAFNEGADSTDKVDEDKVRQEAYQECEQDIANNPDGLPDLVLEKIGVNYATEAYRDCKTLEDFQDKFKEIQTRSFNFM